MYNFYPHSDSGKSIASLNTLDDVVSVLDQQKGERVFFLTPFCLVCFTFS